MTMIWYAEDEYLNEPWQTGC